MVLKSAFLPVLALCWFAIVSPVTAQRVVCYYGSWAVYRQGECKCDVEDIDPFLCTHIIFAFIGLNIDGTPRIMDSWNEVDKAAFERFTCLKKLNPNLKALVAIGGWNEGSLSFSAVAGDPARRATFQRSIINLIKTYGFDGLDLDWEYPNQRGGVPADVANFVTWLRELRVAFDKEGLLLTAAVAACEASASLSYNIPELSKYLDFINVMTYDMHGCWDSVGPAHHAPLRRSPDGLDVEMCMSYWLNRGAPPEKLNLGIAAFGRSFTLRDPNNTGIGAPISGCGQAGPCTRENGFLGYNEICRNNWPRKWHDEQKVPYAVQGNQWVGYDDPESIYYKVDFLKTKRLGGAMVWSLDSDDFLGVCGGGRFPLINAIKRTLGLPVSTGTGWGSPCANRTITWWSPPADIGRSNLGTDLGNGGGGGINLLNSPPSGICRATGYIRDPTNWAIFYYCQPNESTWVVTTFYCPSGTVYNPVNGICETYRGICSAIGYVRDRANCAVYYYCQPNGSTWLISTFYCSSGTVYNTDGFCDWPSNVQC